MPIPRRAAACILASWLFACGAGAAPACPTDAEPRDASTWLTLQWPGHPLRNYAAADLARLPQTRLMQKVSVSAAASAPTTMAAASASASPDRAVVYGGILLRDLLAQAGYGGDEGHSSRFTWIEAMAVDGYRGVFSWGEIFNAAGGDQTLVVTSQDGVPLDAARGPLALRSLADWRPGPRHVRNLCALVVHGP